MKKTIRIIIPVVLAVAILLCTIWYFNVYDREFTRDILLTCARYSEQQGRHEAAAWFYSRAYTQSGDNDAVAIELAQQYIDSGNYTKAEYTLTNAIIDGGGVDLYVALCQTYIEQNKIKDAVTMLDSVKDPTIKEALDAMRPAAPVPTQAPGVYKQLIRVELTAEGSKIYATAGGTFPSVKSDLYIDPIALSEGESNVYAVCINDAGLVSPLSVFGYTINGIVENITFADPAMESAIRAALSVGDQKALLTSDVWVIESFVIPKEAASYADLKFMPKLKELTIEDGVSDQISNLSSLSELEKLTITNTDVSQNDLTAIAALPLLKELTLRNCNLSSISPLSAADGITKLDLSENTVRTLTALERMSDLSELNLDHNAVIDLSAITGLKSLTKLSVSYNSLISLEQLSANTALTWLEASHNNIEVLGQLQKLSGLTHLDLSNNALTDVSVVAACSAITELNISGNKLTDISTLSSLNKLAYLDFSHNSVLAIPQWSADCALVTIKGSYNNIQSIEPLAGLKVLNNVFLDYNEDLSSVDALVDCPKLIQVDIYGTSVTNVKALTHTEDGKERGIIVNYDPTK